MQNRTSDDFIKQIKGDNHQDPGIHKEDFESGIFRAKAVEPVMLEGFRHGKKRGETTHFSAIDPFLTWKRTFVYCWTGYPQHGKTELLLHLALAKSIADGWRWVVFPPENMGNDGKGNIVPDEFYDTLIHSYEGKTTDPKYPNQMKESLYKKALEFMHEYFIVVYPKRDRTINSLLDHFDYFAGRMNVDGYILDPWNKAKHVFIRQDTYLEDKFADIKDFAVSHNAVFNITAHPLRPVKKEDGSLPIPDQYSLSGGQTWDNAMDVVAAVYRPEYHKDKKDQSVDFYSHKLKNQKLIGLPGTASLTFDRITNRYYQSGISPIATLRKQTEARQGEIKLVKNYKSGEDTHGAPF